MEDIQAVCFFDLDGTLLNAKSEIDPEITEAMRQLKQNHVLPVICTGRSLVEIHDIMEAAEIETAITLNGQYISSREEEIYNHPMDKNVIKRLIDFSQQHHNPVAFYNSETIRLNAENENVRQCYHYLYDDAPIPPVDPNYYQHHDVQMMLVFRSADEVDNDYRNAFPELEFYRNGPQNMDVVSRGQSKGNGIRILLNYIGLEDIPTYGFGDGTNDFAMFEQVKYPIAMGNAVEALKEQAIYITTANTDHGIVNALKHFNLI